MDVFSYDNNIKTEGQIASADFARIAVGNAGQNALVQSVEVAYRQQIEEVTQVGSPQIYWLPGRPQGSIGMGSLVGAEGFFKEWQGPCGRIDTATIDIVGGACKFEGTGSLFFSGAIVESLSANITTGRQTITQGAQIRTAGMTAS
jgi:hypothetical protein